MHPLTIKKCNAGYVSHRKCLLSVILCLNLFLPSPSKKKEKKKKRKKQIRNKKIDFPNKNYRVSKTSFSLQSYTSPKKLGTNRVETDN